MENQEKKIQCSKCGATIKESQAYCNYCGSINILGAEIDYRHKLDGIKNDLAEMGDDSDQNNYEAYKLEQMGFTEHTIGEEEEDNEYTEEYVYEEEAGQDDFGIDE